ncbi:MAG: rhodanese-like domain-containing protein [bacterium]
MSTRGRITARELSQRLQQGDDLLLVDVREADELAIARFPHALHIPLATVPLRLAELPTDRTIVLACHHGGRSMQALQFLKARGYTTLLNLEGGIDAWSRDVDRAVARY